MLRDWYLGNMLNFTGIPPEICGTAFQWNEENMIQWKMMLDNFTRCWWSKDPEVSHKKANKNHSGHETFRRRFLRELESGAEICVAPHGSSPEVVFRSGVWKYPKKWQIWFRKSGNFWKKNQDQLHLVPFLQFFVRFFLERNIVANTPFSLGSWMMKIPVKLVVAQPNCCTCRSTSNGTRTNARRSARRN